jgi:hypothetical protein
MKIEQYRKMKKYGEGAMKRKLGIGRKDEAKPGYMISKANALKRKLAVKGLV